MQNGMKIERRSPRRGRRHDCPRGSWPRRRDEDLELHSTPSLGTLREEVRAKRDGAPYRPSAGLLSTRVGREIAAS